MLNRNLAEDDALADIFYEEPIVVDDDDDDIVSSTIQSPPYTHSCNYTLP